MKDELMEKMKLSDIHGKEKNYETVLHESRLAVQNYVRTGYKSKQLGLIIDCEDKFHENYKKLLETELHKEIVPNLPKLLYIGSKPIPQTAYKINDCGSFFFTNICINDII